MEAKAGASILFGVRLGIDSLWGNYAKGRRINLQYSRAAAAAALSISFAHALTLSRSRNVSNANDVLTAHNFLCVQLKCRQCGL